MLRLAMAALVVAGLTGCLIDEKRYNPPFACYNTTLPTDAPPQIVFSGTVSHPASGDMVAGATVGVYFDNAPTTELSHTTTDASGAYELRQGFGPVAPDAFLKITFNGYVETRFYPAVPPTGNLHVDIQMLSTTDIMNFALLTGIQPGIDPHLAMFSISVTDCNDHALGGATVQTEQPGVVRYLDANAKPSPTAAATDMTTGTGFVFNVPLGSTNITSKVDGMNLRAHRIDALENIVFETAIQP